MSDPTVIKIQYEIGVPGMHNVTVDGDGEISVETGIQYAGDFITFTRKEIDLMSKVARAHHIAYQRYRDTDFESELTYFQYYEKAMGL